MYLLIIASLTLALFSIILAVNTQMFAQGNVWTATASMLPTVQKWTPGWDNFREPLDFIHSNITWSVSPASRTLAVTFRLVGARPNKLYQVGVHIMDCSRVPATYSQFPFCGGAGRCTPIIRQGVTDTVAAVEFGVVTTDVHGNGSFSIIVGPIPSGRYDLEFHARNGAECNLASGRASDPSHCNADFQSPGPTFGTQTTITIS